jgi:putative membrane-bound dehydrogenase-like protein
MKLPARNTSFRLACTLIALLHAAAIAWGQGQTDAPRAHDDALTVELFAAAPDIVHPVGAAFDGRGRLLVIESHTHFRPKDYKGPSHDRIRVLEDTDGDGKADRFTTFYEGTTATMGIAAHPDGSIYLATRNAILRLRDTKGSGKADEVRRIAFLDTKGDYPHNGLSGLAFDSKGNLYFGMGENIGFDYKLIGADGTTLTGGGEGGNIYWCTADGKKLRRVATGFWNPFGICRDVFGRLFAVDNDPDAMPPCRMVHVVEGADFGYQYRYGRSGRHPFQAWDGQLPGTLPMVTGVGEAPCQVLAYESDGLPSQYLGSLLVASWADHRVERYVVKERGASVSAERLPFVQGGKDFRPVGIAVAPDGSLFVSDWVRSDYTLHGKGAIWHIRARQPVKIERPNDPRKALFAVDRATREAAARKLAAEFASRPFLREQMRKAADARVQAACLTALVDVNDDKLELADFADKETITPLRALAVRSSLAWGEDRTDFIAERYPAAVRMEAIGSLSGPYGLKWLLRLVTDADPFLRHAAVQHLGHSPKLLTTVEIGSLTDARQRIALLLAWRASGRTEGARKVRDFLADPDPEVRFLAAKWIADDKLTDDREPLLKALEDPKLDVRMYLAYATALARLDGQEVSETRMADYFAQRLQDDAVPAPLRIQLLRQVPSAHPKLTVNLLGKLLAQTDEALKLEAVRALVEHPNPKRTALLQQVFRNPKLADSLRAHATLGLTDPAQDVAAEMFTIARTRESPLRADALRALIGVKLDAGQLTELQDSAQGDSRWAVRRLVAVGKKLDPERPPAKDVDAWLKRLDGPADADAGRRIFFHPKLASCYKCHRSEGRGTDLGPDLSTIGRTERRGILESILQPSALIAPHYQAWQIEMRDGKVRTGMLVKTVLDEYTYLDAQGQLFKVNTRDIAETRASTQSIMPDGLADLMTDQEMRDLLAYLCSRR